MDGFTYSGKTSGIENGTPELKIAEDEKLSNQNLLGKRQSSQWLTDPMSSTVWIVSEKSYKKRNNFN